MNRKSVLTPSLSFVAGALAAASLMFVQGVAATWSKPPKLASLPGPTDTAWPFDRTTQDALGERAPVSLGRGSGPTGYYQRECLAFNVYHEARGEPRLGQLAVAAVTLNRVRSSAYPNNLCDVVLDDYQFSWVGEVLTAEDKRAWERANRLVEAILAEESTLVDPTGGALHYHAHSVSPDWSRRMDVAVVIGNHRFYEPAR